MIEDSGTKQFMSVMEMAVMSALKVATVVNNPMAQHIHAAVDIESAILSRMETMEFTAAYRDVIDRITRSESI